MRVYLARKEDPFDINMRNAILQKVLKRTIAS